MNEKSNIYTHVLQFVVCLLKWQISQSKFIIIRKSFRLHFQKLTCNRFVSRIHVLWINNEPCHSLFTARYIKNGDSFIVIESARTYVDRYTT